MSYAPRSSAQVNSWIVLFASTILGVNPYLPFVRFRLRIAYWV
jgi:hypothetical protein